MKKDIKIVMEKHSVKVMVIFETTKDFGQNLHI